MGQQNSPRASTILRCWCITTTIIAFIMVQGMAFLSKKGFNPHNNSNRKQVWEAQQRTKQEKERLRKRQEQLKKEQEDEEFELATKGKIGGSQAQLRFMYDAPPGMETSKAHTDNRYGSRNQDDEKTDSFNDVKPGDDAAAVAFRQMFAAAASSGSTGVGKETHSDNDSVSNKAFKFTPSLQGSMVEADSRYNNADAQQQNETGNNKFQDSRSALEKEVGRKNRSFQNNLSYEQQIERFPQLKNAPMTVRRGTTSEANGGEAGSSAPMMVHFKPLGSQILHVRCLACGVWGHAKGDRECKKSGWNPFAMPSSTSTTEGRQNLNNSTKTTSSILKSKRDDSPVRNGSSRRKKYKEYSTSEHYHNRLHDESDDSNYRRYGGHSKRDDDSISSRKRDRRRHKKHRHHYKSRNYSSDDNSHSDSSSIDSSKFKRRDDDRYDTNSEDSGNHHRRHDRERKRKRYRDRKSSKGRSHRKHKREKKKSRR